MKNIISDIHKAQLKTFCSLDSFLDKETCPLLNKHRGLYWFWTDLSINDLAKGVEGNINKEVPIKKLIAHRKDLNFICKVKDKKFRIVYNGIGGYNKEPAKFGLRERIRQEFQGNGPTVGTLNIQRVSSSKNWAVSYFDFDAKENRNIIKKLKSENPYLDYAKDLEIMWRIEYGVPILCRH
jgi:hypothetical protein